MRQRIGAKLKLHHKRASIGAVLVDGVAERALAHEHGGPVGRVARGLAAGDAQHKQDENGRRERSQAYAMRLFHELLAAAGGDPVHRNAQRGRWVGPIASADTSNICGDRPNNTSHSDIIRHASAPAFG
jgi:hypothetical protein